MDTFQQMRRIKHAEYRMNFPLAKREERKEDIQQVQQHWLSMACLGLRKCMDFFVWLQCHLLSEHKNTPTNE